MNKNIVDKAFDLFVNSVEAKEKQNNIIKKNNEDITKEKDMILMPIKILLKKLVDANVYVWDASRFERGMLKSDRRNLPPQKLQVYEDASNPMWLPGRSLYLKHPAQIEISVPNEKDRERSGLIQISCSDHPNKSIFYKGFKNADDACLAIVDFLSKNTISMNNDDSKRDNDIDEMIDGIGTKK